MFRGGAVTHPAQGWLSRSVRGTQEQLIRPACCTPQCRGDREWMRPLHAGPIEAVEKILDEDFAQLEVVAEVHLIGLRHFHAKIPEIALQDLAQHADFLGFQLDPNHGTSRCCRIRGDARRPQRAASAWPQTACARNLV